MYKLTKKFLILFLCIVLTATVLISCGVNDENTGYSPTPVNPPPSDVSDGASVKFTKTLLTNPTFGYNIYEVSTIE